MFTGPLNARIEVQAESLSDLVEKRYAMKKIKNVTVLGSGVQGSQIAFQAAFRGFDVTVWDVDDSVIPHARKRVEAVAAMYAEEKVAGADPDTLERTLRAIQITSDLAESVARADLVIEAVPEDIEIKRSVWSRVGKAAPAETIFTTNTSTLLPSSFSDATGRPDKFLALHYASHLWKRNVVEVMGTPATAPDVVDTVYEFAKEQGMLPVRLRKEKPAYIMNTLVLALLNAAVELYIEGVADIEEIDLTWRVTHLTPLGPFQLFDLVGMATVYNVYSVGSELQRQFAEIVKRDYIDKGKLGIPSGEGFYVYNNV